MPLRVAVEYLYKYVTMEQVFLISYDRTVEYKGDYDYEYSLAMAEFAGTDLDNQTLFLHLFLNEGAIGLFKEPFAKKAFCKAIYEQGLAAFLDGAEIPEAEELEILAETLSWAIKSKAYDYEDMTLCQRIYQLMGPNGQAEIDVEVNDYLGSGTISERRSGIEQTLRINRSGSYTDIVTWTATAIKRIINPITFEYEFDIKTDFDVGEDIESLCQCLGVHPPDDDFSKEIVQDPFYPNIDLSGKFALLYTSTKDPVSPATALATYRFGNIDDAIQTVDVSTEIMWEQKNSKKYKITLVEITSQDPYAESEARRR